MDKRFGRLRRDVEDPRHLAERKVQIEEEEERSALALWQGAELSIQIELGLDVSARRLVLSSKLGKPDDRPPPRSANRAALVGDDSEEPGPQLSLIPQLVQLSPGGEA